jgi:hypothetical protein
LSYRLKLEEIVERLAGVIDAGRGGFALDGRARIE